MIQQSVEARRFGVATEIGSLPLVRKDIQGDHRRFIQSHVEIRLMRFQMKTIRLIFI